MCPCNIALGEIVPDALESRVNPAKRVMAASVLFGLAAAAGVVSAQSAPAMTAVMTAAEKSGFSGVVIVGDRTKTLFERASGLADRSKQTAHAVDQPWRLGAISKQITSIIAAQLVAEGKLDLDKAIAHYLNVREFGGANARQVTIHQLLQHTSGLPEPGNTEAEAGAKADDDAVPDFYLADVMPEAIHKTPTSGTCAGVPKRAPGDQFEYNNCDYLVLAAVIEKITGHPFATALAERIAKPLSLAKGGLRLASIKDKYAQPVKGYQDARRREATFNLAAYGAAGAVLGTPRELLAIDQALLGDALMSAESKKECWRSDPKFDYAAFGVWSYPASLTGCKEPVNLVEQRGAIGGVQVRNFLAPGLGKAVIVLTNRGDWAFGEVAKGGGFSAELLTAALCAN